MICSIANNKGKITRHFFMKGLGLLSLSWELEKFKKENNISDEMFRQMQAYAGIDDDV